MTKARPLAIAGAVLVAAVALLGVARPGIGRYPVLRAPETDSSAPAGPVQVGSAQLGSMPAGRVPAGPAPAGPAPAAIPPVGAFGAQSPAPPAGTATSPTHACTVGPKLVPTCGVLWGVAPGAFTAVPREEALRDFEVSTGRPQAIYHAYHRGIREMFPTRDEIAVARQPGRAHILLLNWKPEVASWASIAAGNPQVDAFIDRLAAHLRSSFPEPFFLTVHHEPENDVRERAGSGYTAADYRAMFRHVILRLRRDGASHVVSVMDYMAFPPWNAASWFNELYPGNDVVDWVAWDTYGYSTPGYGYGDFTEMMNRASPSRHWPGFYAWASRQFPDKPLMVAEWGVWRSAQQPVHPADLFDSAGQQIDRFPRIKALVYFDSPNAGGRDSRVEDASATLLAYRNLGLQRVFQVHITG